MSFDQGVKLFFLALLIVPVGYAIRTIIPSVQERIVAQEPVQAYENLLNKIRIMREYSDINEYISYRYREPFKSKFGGSASLSEIDMIKHQHKFLAYVYTEYSESDATQCRFSYEAAVHTTPEEKIKSGETRKLIQCEVTMRLEESRWLLANQDCVTINN